LREAASDPVIARSGAGATKHSLSNWITCLGRSQ